MFAGSVMSRTPTPASAILIRVLASLSENSSSGNAAIPHLHHLFSADEQLLEHALGDLAILEAAPLVAPVRALLDTTRSEQDAWYPGRVHEKARVAGGPPRGDLLRE